MIEIIESAKESQKENISENNKSNKISNNNNINKISKESEKKSSFSMGSKAENQKLIWEASEKGSQHTKSIKKEKKNYGYLFKVIKLGKRGFSHKERILHLDNNFISYYVMPDKNNSTKEFYDILEKIYNSKLAEDKALIKFKNLAELWTKIPEKEKNLKNKFQNYTIEPSKSGGQNINDFTFTVINKDDNNAENNFWILDAGEDIIKNNIFLANQKLTQDLGDSSESSHIFRKNKKIKKIENILTKKEEYQKDKISSDKMIVLNDFKDKIKYIGIMYQGFMKEYLQTICDFSKKRRKYEYKINLKKETNYINLNPEQNNFFASFNESKAQTKKERFKKYNQINTKNEINIGFNDRVNYNDIDKNMSGPLKEHIKDTIKIAYLELAIYYYYDIFVKYCEKVVEKIVSHLYTFDKADDILIPDKLHPIVFPNPSNFIQILDGNIDKSDESSEPVLLYSIWGVNYTLTWHNLTYKFGQTLGSSGNWKPIKHQFQQKNYFQDLLIKLASIADSTDNFPSIPMSCVIDYNGFRVYCESDIFANEEYLEGMRMQLNKKDMEFINNIMELISNNNSEDSNKIEDSDIYCKIKSEYIAEEKGFNLNQYIKTMTDEFLKSFNQGNIGNDNKKIDPFTEMQSQRPIINSITRLFTDDRTVMGEDKAQFENYQNDSIEFQKNLSLQYLMYFDVLIAVDPSMRKKDTVYYRQELVVNNINLKEEIKQLGPNYYQNNEINDYNLENNSIEGKSFVSKVSSEKDNLNDANNNKTQKKNLKEKKIEIKPKKIFKSADELIIEIIRKNSYQNNDNIRTELKSVFNKKLSNLITALDSLYLVPYNSETLKICFHYYGINLHYLGKVAERTTVPHIREMCVIEMFARVCKKIIFDLMGQSTYERAMKAFYSNIKELTTKLHCIPVSLNVLYGSNYLKSITQPIERGKSYYKNMEITGLYLNNEEYPLSEIKFDKEKKINNESEYNMGKYQKVNSFLILLFGGFLSKSDLIINGKEIKKVDELWNLIKNIIRKKYEITNEDVFMYCELDTISIYSLAGAIQYHTGLQFQNEIAGLLEKVMSQKLENVVFENLSPIPKKSYYSFSYFLCKENIILPLTNNFAMFFPDRIKYNKAKLNYYAEKYLYKKKISQNFYYLNYLKILKEWDLGANPKAGNQQSKNDEFEKNLSINDYSPVQLSPLFEENFDSFIALILTQYQPKTQRKALHNDNQDIQNKADINLIFTCTKIISTYWKNDKHPFISILKSTYAKALFKNSRNRKEEIKIESNLNDSVKIARDSMGELNLFYGKLTRDVGMFYEKNFKFKEAYEMFYLSYRVFKKHKKVFKREYFYSLKNLTKTCVFLGRLQDSLHFGITLVEEITKDSNKVLNDPLKVNDYSSLVDEEQKIDSWNQIHNMNAFTYNLMKVAKYLKEYDLCVKIGNIFFTRIENYKTFRIYQFKNWLEIAKNRTEKLMITKNNQNNKGEIKLNREHRIDESSGKDKRIDSIIKCYLKCLFRGLKGVQNKVYARAYLAFLENCNNQEFSQMNQEKIDELFYEMFFRVGVETFDEHLKNRILYYLLQKYSRENLNKEDIDNSYKIARRDLELIYYKFRKKAKKIFLLPD